MATATVTSKGQVTIPKEVRASLQLEAGDKVSFVLMPGGRATLVRHNRDIRDLAGILYEPGRPPATVAEMNEAIAEGAAESGLPTRQQ